MKSTIRVKHDFSRNEEYLQLRLDGLNEEDPDLKDEHLAHFVQTANGSLMYITYEDGGNGLPQIRVLTPYRTPEELMQFIIGNFETFARQYFQETELTPVDAFFSALKVKVMLKAEVKIPAKQSPHVPETI